MTTRQGPLRGLRGQLARNVAPPRLVAFVFVTGLAGWLWHLLRGRDYLDSLVVGFDIGVVFFALTLLPLLTVRCADAMRRHAAENDAGRSMVIGLTVVVTLAVLAAIIGELPAAKAHNWHAVAKLVGTLALSWSFANLVFALHYAHMHYAPAPGGGDAGGFEFPGTPEPDYWDFVYFAFTAGMSFAASDVDVTHGGVRRILLVHSLLSFVFNIGVIAFSINVLAGSS
ncbi:MAG: DUF1345 domain-containing protein [Sphingomonadaceae bacterium]|mgnify:CR=1 FL=1